VVYLRKEKSVGISSTIRNTKEKEGYAMMTIQTYTLPQDIEESINELLRLKKEAYNPTYNFRKVMKYKSQMEILITDLKMAALDGEISQSVFEELVWEYQVI